MTFKERFIQSTNWPDKARLIELYYLTQKAANPRWTQKATARYFGLADETVSEYMTLADAMHKDEKFESRYRSHSKEKTLRILGHYRYNKRRYDHLDEE